MPFDLLLSLLLLTSFSPVGTEEIQGFLTPSGNIACILFEDRLRCDLRQNDAPPQPKPAECELDWGRYFGLGLTGPARRLCVGDTTFGNWPVLAYGHVWRYKGMVCHSRREGLTCRNRSGHGWTLNRIKQILF